MRTRRTTPRGHAQHRPPGEDVKKRLRAARALELRLVGATYRAIAQQLGVSECAAYYDVQDELGRLDAVTGPRAERLRELELRRCDRLQLALDPAASTGHPPSVMASIRVMDRRAKLLGLDAPTQITGAGGAPIAVIRMVRDGD